MKLRVWCAFALVAIAGCRNITAHRQCLLDAETKRQGQLILELASLPDPGPTMLESVDERKVRLLLELSRITRRYTTEEIREVLKELSRSSKQWNTDAAFDAKVFLLCRFLFAVPSSKDVGTNYFGTVPAWASCEPLDVKEDGETYLTEPVVVFPWFSGPRFDYVEHFDTLRRVYGKRKTPCYPSTSAIQGETRGTNTAIPQELQHMPQGRPRGGKGSGATDKSAIE